MVEISAKIAANQASFKEWDEPLPLTRYPPYRSYLAPQITARDKHVARSTAMSGQNNTVPAKTGQACLPCRTRKVKCLSNPHAPECLTCERSGATCEWTQPNVRVRKKKKLGSKARIAVLESRLEQLVSGLEVGRESRDDTFATTSSSQTSSSGEDPLTSVTTQEADWQRSHVYSPVQVDCCTADDTRAANTVSQHNISLEDAEQYLVRFREMTLYFPFVVLSAHCSISSLSKHNPMLFHAILTAASSSNKRIQESLEKTLRASLLERILLDGEKSLDLLAALLVYLAWYHFYCVPKLQAFTQLIQMAVGLCRDLGLHLGPEEAMAVKVGMNLQHYRKVDEPESEHDDFFSPEARRLLLGCYYLSCR